MATTADLRRFLTDAFGDEDITTLCFDHFRPVYDNFSTGMSKGQKIQLLLEHCERRDEWPILLPLLRRERPQRFDQFLDANTATDSPSHVTGGDLGNYLMAALPNATYFGFTGTPIDRTAYGQGTFKTFGVDDAPQGYLHKYSIRESIEDGTTLPLAPNELRVPAETMEAEFFALAETEGIADIEGLNQLLDRAVNLKNFLKGDLRHPHAAQPQTHQGRTRASEGHRAGAPRHAESRASRARMAQPTADPRRVLVAIQEVLENLPQKYSDDDYRVKCEAVFQHVYDSYYGAGRSVYGVAGL